MSYRLSLHIWQYLAESGIPLSREKIFILTSRAIFKLSYDFGAKMIVKSADSKNGALLLATMGQDLAQYGMRIKMKSI